MTYILTFLRNLDKRRIIFILKRIVSAVMPMRPYETCGMGRCPCPCQRHRDRPQSVTGIAAANESASVHIGLKERTEWPIETKHIRTFPAS